MATQQHISATCRIADGKVIKNGNIVFENPHQNVLVFLQSAYLHFGISYSRFYKMDTLSKLGWLASEILLMDNFEKDKYQPYQKGMVFANANASLDTDIKYMASAADIASPSLFVYTLPNIMTGEISIRNDFKGETIFFISEAFDKVFIEQYVNNLFLMSDIKVCICGWIDVLAEAYQAVLFLVEQGNSGVPFTVDNMKKI